MIKKIVLVSLTILWMITIFLFSNQGSTKSTEKSNSFVVNTIVRVYKLFDNNVTDEEINNIIEFWEVPVRKTAHFTEFLILGILVFLTFRAFEIKNIYWMILLCFIYACSDEIHQLFVVGRDGNIIDVLIDCFGSIIAILVLNKLKERKKYEVH
jgi:VanZ family protein